MSKPPTVALSRRDTEAVIDCLNLCHALRAALAHCRIAIIDGRPDPRDAGDPGATHCYSHIAIETALASTGGDREAEHGAAVREVGRLLKALQGEGA